MQTHSHNTQKVTAHIPVKLLHDAQAVTGKGITETLREGLEKLAVSKVYAKLLKLRGQYHFSLDLNELREDRDKR